MKRQDEEIHGTRSAKRPIFFGKTFMPDAFRFFVGEACMPDALRRVAEKHRG